MRAILLLTAITILAAGSVFAAVPTTMNYQGYLIDNVGDPVADGSYSVVFTIYDDPTAGTSVWTETQSVTTTGGLFAVLLGTVNPIIDTVFNGTTRYMGIAVGGDSVSGLVLNSSLIWSSLLINVTYHLFLPVTPSPP